MSGLLLPALLGLGFVLRAQDQSAYIQEPSPLPAPRLDPRALSPANPGWKAPGSQAPVIPVAAEDIEEPPAYAPPGVAPVPSLAPGARRRGPQPLPVPSDAPTPASEFAPADIAPSDASQGKSILKRPSGGARTVTDDPLPAAPAAPNLKPAPLPTAPIPREAIEGPNSPSDKPSSRRLPKVNLGGEDTDPAAKSYAPSIREMSFRSVSPQLRLETRGPQAINIGKESKYFLDLFNEGDAPAPEIQVRVALPNHVTLQKPAENATVTPDHGGQRVQWTVPGIEARGRKTLELLLTATEGKPVELAVEWAFRPNGHKAQVSVRQPQLQVAVSGPGEIGFGEEKPFRVMVTNSGTGDAEGVIVTASATGNRAQKFDVGVLPAGQSKEFTATFVANQPGELDVVVGAAGDQELNAESAAKVLVRRAELAATLDGPPLKYAGSEAVYAIEVSNSGNAAANDVQLSLTMPAGAKYLGGIDGAVQSGTTLKWQLGQVPAGNARTFELTLQLGGAGDNKFDLQARGAKAGVAAASQFVTRVEALADLKLVVNDPVGPFPTGGEVVYDVQVLNRGTNAAKNIKIVMHFSEGIEPTAADGGQARLLPGQVLFDPLPSLEAGEKAALKIKAKADIAGNHLFRIEAICAEPETRLVSEGTTRFIEDKSPRLSRKPTPAPAAGGTIKR